MAKRPSFPLEIHCKTEHHRDLLKEAILTIKDIYNEGEDSDRIPPFSDASQTMLWAKMTIERCIKEGVWRDQTEDFEVYVSWERNPEYVGV